MLFAYLGAAILMTLCFGLVYWAKSAQLEARAESGEAENIFDKGKASALSVLCAGVIALINVLLAFAMYMFSEKERTHTQTAMNVNIAFKLTLARFLNSSIILVIVQTHADQWFDAGGLVEDASILILLMTAQYSIVYGANLPGLYKHFMAKYQQSLGQECRMTQKEANTLCEGPECDVPDNISNFMNFLMTCIFYCPLIPIAIPCALVGIFLNYWVSKYMLFRKHKVPD